MDKLKAMVNIALGRPVIYNVVFVDSIEVEDMWDIYSYKSRITSTIPSCSGEEFPLNTRRLSKEETFAAAETAAAIEVTIPEDTFGTVKGWQGPKGVVFAAKPSHEPVMRVALDEQTLADAYKYKGESRGNRDQ